MIENYFRSEHMRARLRTGPRGPHLPPLIAVLEQQCFGWRQVHRMIGTADALGRWLAEQGISLREANESHARAFGSHFDRTPLGRLTYGAKGVPCIVGILQAQGVRNAPRPQTDTDHFLQRFDEHLAHVHGISSTTRANYLCYARRFLASRPGGAVPDWGRLRAEDIHEFVQSEAATLQPGGSCRQVTTAVRALIRFLAANGSVALNLAKAIPPIRDWKQAGLPKHFSPEQLDRVLTVCREDSSISFRDRAILLLLVRLGMRSGEVRQLQLEDVDWAEAVIRIRLGKSRHERTLPLPEDAGAALTSYLRTERPPSSYRTIFLLSCAPYTPLASIAAIVKRVLNRAGITGRGVGAHHFRHTVATQMVRRGVAFKEVADVLGHRRLETTAIYAKLDLPSLVRVALPWPGGAR